MAEYGSAPWSSAPAPPRSWMKSPPASTSGANAATAAAMRHATITRSRRDGSPGAADGGGTSTLRSSESSTVIERLGSPSKPGGPSRDDAVDPGRHAALVRPQQNHHDARDVHRRNREGKLPCVQRQHRSIGRRVPERDEVAQVRRARQDQRLYRRRRYQEKR